MIIGGVDEAGRGPVIGPMVVVLVLARREAEAVLARAGVRDSKKLTPSRRVALARLVENVAEGVFFEKVSSREIDLAVMGRTDPNLNHLEARVMASLLSRAGGMVGKVFIDSPHPVPGKFEEMLRSMVGWEVGLVVENGADAKYPVVSAASIVAKVLRDREIERLKRRFGDFGSGYPSDPRTIRFLEEWVMRNCDLPPFARRSWRTARRILETFGKHCRSGG